MWGSACCSLLLLLFACTLNSQVILLSSWILWIAVVSWYVPFNRWGLEDKGKPEGRGLKYLKLEPHKASTESEKASLPIHPALLVCFTDRPQIFIIAYRDIVTKERNSINSLLGWLKVYPTQTKHQKKSFFFLPWNPLTSILNSISVERKNEGCCIGQRAYWHPCPFNW